MININDLTLREKICQTVIINEPEKLFEQYGGYKEFFKKYPVGGIYLGGAIVGGNLPGTEEYFEYQDNWNDEMKVPMIFCCDGVADSLKTSNMALGAVNDADVAYRKGKIEARICSKDGAHWQFQPIVDLAFTYHGQVNVLGVGDDPDKACELMGRLIDGYIEEDVIATAKHFPGIGGSGVNLHIAPVSLEFTKEEWDKNYRKIYQNLIDRGLMSIMTTHMSLPCYQKERDKYGAAPIATCSKELITDLLKNDMGFGGVVVTDAMTMGGCGVNALDMEIAAFEAGHDMILWPNMEYVDAVEEKILKGEIPMERLDDAVSRILKIKEISFNKKRAKIEKSEIDAMENEIAEKSLTLLNNYENLLPINPEKIKKILLVYVANCPNSLNKLKYLEEVFAKRGIEIITRESLWIYELQELEKEVDMTLFACYEGFGGTPGPICINGENGASVWASQSSDKSKTVVASFGSPFLYHQYYRYFPTYVNTYSHSKPSCEAFVKALFGEIGFEGTSPVKL